MRVSDAQRCVSVCEDAFRLLTSGDYLMSGSSRNSHGMGLSARSTWGHLARGIGQRLDLWGHQPDRHRQRKIGGRHHIVSTISGINARQVLDIGGRPLVEVEVHTSDGHVGRGAAPTGRLRRAIRERSVDGLISIPSGRSGGVVADPASLLREARVSA